MNAREHYAEAERLLILAERIDFGPAAGIIASAQVHATLALAAATIDLAEAPA